MSCALLPILPLWLAKKVMFDRVSFCATGDRYLLKLFRDFVFHQMDEEGRPILDWGHMVEALNKLDAAVPEQVPT